MHDEADAANPTDDVTETLNYHFTLSI